MLNSFREVSRRRFVASSISDSGCTIRLCFFNTHRYLGAETMLEELTQVFLLFFFTYFITVDDISSFQLRCFLTAVPVLFVYVVTFPATVDLPI